MPLRNQIEWLKSKSKFHFGIACLLIVVLICAAFSLNKNDNYYSARQDIILRKIGHEVLLAAGDSTSRVLPFQSVAAGEYQIRFEHDFSFMPDSLVSIVSRSLAKTGTVQNYVVRVLDCPGKEIIFGYAIAGDEKESLIPCLGRTQPKECYIIDVQFQDGASTVSRSALLLGGLALTMLFGIFISGLFKNRPSKNKGIVVSASNGFSIGNTFFDPVKRQLMTGALVTNLTIKENKLLLLLAASPGILIERSRLQKEIWEDEGVIVGRSLDVFISRLRKLLEADAHLRIINVHGKGYKLDTTS